MKTLIVNALINQISGDYPIMSTGGARGVVGFRFKKASKKHYLQATGQRDYEKKPLSSRELAARNAFKSASAQAKAIINDEAQKAAAMVEWNNAVANGSTKATTLHGYLMQKFI